MALTVTVSGSVENADLYQLVIERAGDGSLLGRVTYKITVDGVSVQRSAEWTLTPTQQSTIVTSFLASAKAAITTHLGL